MNDMQRSASSGTRQPRAPSSVLRTCGLHHAGFCGNRVEGKFSWLQTIEIARNGKIYGMQRRCVDAGRNRDEPQAPASEVSCRLRRRSLAVAASSPRRFGANTTRFSRPTEAGDQAVRARPPLPAPDRVARGRPCRHHRAGAAPAARRSSRGNRSRPEMAPQRLEKIESAPGKGMGSKASNPLDLVHGRSLTSARLQLAGRANDVAEKGA
jgi:hypothetical protein